LFTTSIFYLSCVVGFAVVNVNIGFSPSYFVSEHGKPVRVFSKLLCIRTWKACFTCGKDGVSAP